MDYEKAYFNLYGEMAELIEKMQEIQKRYEEEYINNNPNVKKNCSLGAK